MNKKILLVLMALALFVAPCYAASDIPDRFTHFNGIAITEGLRLPTVAKDESYSVLASESMTIFTNKGATSTVGFTLPSASTVKGRPFIFVVYNAVNAVSIDVQDTDTILYGGLALDAGDKITADDDGEFIVLVPLDDTPAWVPIAAGGTWTDGGS